MKRHILALAMIIAFATGVTLTHQNAYAKAKQAQVLQPSLQDGNPMPLCPPPPAPCK